MLKRYLGIALHTNSFTCCMLHADGSETIRTWPLQGGGWEQVVHGLQPEDAIALEATGNAAHFCKAVEPVVGRCRDRPMAVRGDPPVREEDGQT